MIARDMMVNVKDGLNVGTVALFIQEASQFDILQVHHLSLYL